MQLKASTSAAKFSPRLESLRGIAALVVLLCHAFMVVRASGWQQSVIEIGGTVLFNGKPPVVLFFILSGYVLRLSWDRSSKPLVQRYLIFAFRRVLRIYPAFLVVSLASLLLWWHFDTRATLSEATNWFKGTLNNHVFEK